MTAGDLPKPEAKAKGWRDVLPVHPAADLFPLMEGDDFAALVEDVRKHDLRIPITVWQDVVTGTQYLLEGRNRLRALIASGRELHDYYFHVVGLCESTRDPYAYVISANIHRRHLTPEQRRDLIAKLIKAAPEKSDRQIADTIKASPTTVGTVRAKLEASGDVSKLDTRQDTKGRKQPTKKKRRTADDFAADMKARKAAEAEQKPSPAEPVIDRAELSMSAQEKLDAAIRQHKKQFAREFEQHVRSEVNRRIDEIMLPFWKETIEVAKTLYDRRKALMDKATFNTIRRALHPDSRQAISDQKLREAFVAFMALEKFVLNEKDSPTTFPDLPNSLAEWDKMRAKTKSARRSSTNSVQPRHRP